MAKLNQSDGELVFSGAAKGGQNAFFNDTLADRLNRSLHNIDHIAELQRDVMLVGGGGDEHSRTFDEEEALERKKSALEKMKKLLQAEAAHLDEEKRWLVNEKQKVRKLKGVSFGPAAGEEDSLVFGSNRTDPAHYAPLGDEEKDLRILKGKLALETKLNKELNHELGLEIENLSTARALRNREQARRRSASRRARRSSTSSD